VIGLSYEKLFDQNLSLVRTAIRVSEMLPVSTNTLDIVTTSSRRRRSGSTSAATAPRYSQRRSRCTLTQTDTTCKRSNEIGTSIRSRNSISRSDRRRDGERRSRRFREYIANFVPPMWLTFTSLTPTSYTTNRFRKSGSSVTSANCFSQIKTVWTDTNDASIRKKTTPTSSTKSLLLLKDLFSASFVTRVFAKLNYFTHMRPEITWSRCQNCGIIVRW
jgi:hypothetical protein